MLRVTECYPCFLREWDLASFLQRLTHTNFTQQLQQRAPKQMRGVHTGRWKKRCLLTSARRGAGWN